ncbi:MAG: class I SAM-dependent methyltransferase [Archangium sp.]|nr:class I SAM-dependent methyltransferase [Archangium sp.]
MPEWPFAIDAYGGFAHVMEYPRRKQLRDGSIDEARAEVVRSISAALELPTEKIFTKTHEKRPWGRGQYERVGANSQLVTVEEHGLAFECNLSDYLDTGLFLDHRVTRARVRKEASGKRFLNLFAYTGSFTVHACAGGARSTTTVDLSNTYCDWAERNLKLNGVTPSGTHRVIRADVLGWVEDCKEQFDLIVLDPPSFSTSKKMGRRFEMQRDHRWLIEKTRSLLSENGALFFSTNFLQFELDARLAKDAEPLDSLPEDFRRPVHRAWLWRGRLADRHGAVADVEGDRQHREDHQRSKRR